MASSLGKNRAYLKSLTAQLRAVPQVALAEVAIRAFTGVLGNTEIDSGQAMYSWIMQPYSGSPSFSQQQMYWGYGNVTPTYPVGYKWTGGSNAEMVLMERYQHGMQAKSEIENKKFDGVAIYNPIKPGFPGFAPGDDTRYYSNALGMVEENLARIIQLALTEGYRATASRFSFVRFG